MDKLGMRGSDTCELIFENCPVPAENVLGQVDALAWHKLSSSGELDYAYVWAIKRTEGVGAHT